MATAVAEPLAARCAEAVERISRGKRITIVDGVGYPSVGSIVGCSSADVAVACRSPVLIVGRPGVGDAVDAFNLCASYFEARRVPVLGGILNKGHPTGYYSQAKCDEYVRKYLKAHRPRQRLYGSLPKHETLAAVGADEPCALSYTPPPEPLAAGELSAEDRAAIALVGELFKQHVDVAALLADLELAERRPAEWVRHDECFPNTAINWTPLERLRTGLHVAAVAIATAGAASAALSANAANADVARIAMRQRQA